MNWKSVLALTVCTAALPAQTPPVSTLAVRGENFVGYVIDTYDVFKWGTVPSRVPLPARTVFTPTFKQQLTLVDLVSVNGQPVKGHLVGQSHLFESTSRQTPGRPLLDAYVGDIFNQVFSFLLEDGTFIGSIAITSTFMGVPPPGAPEIAGSGVGIVTGGSGAFLGVRGQVSDADASGIRGASITEDPAFRRQNGGGKITWLLQLIPSFWPEVASLPTGPAVYHSSDFAPVTTGNPARAGEQLTVRATGLGAVRPRLDSGKPFPPYPGGALHTVVSPVGVTVDGKDAEVINKIGWPGSTGAYRVDFLVPKETEAGMASVVLSAAWIRGPEVKIPVR